MFDGRCTVRLYNSLAGLVIVTIPASTSVSMLLARWGVVTLGITIPVSVAADNLMLFIMLVTVLFSGSRKVLHNVVHNPVARASTLLFSVLLLCVAYGSTPIEEAAVTLRKYADLAFVPLLMVAARDTESRRYAMLGFLTVMVVTALLSWLVGLHILALQKWMWAYDTPAFAMSPAIFRSQVTQNVLMSYAVYLLALLASVPSAAKIRWWLAGLAALAGGSVLFMVQGKTGYLVLLALWVYFVWGALARHLRSLGRNISWREGTGVGIFALILIFSAYFASPRLHERLDIMAAEFQAWQPNMHNKTSTGERLEFYYNTFLLIKQHPLMGVGTGGFLTAYTQQMQGKNVELTSNPHNEYLLITAQVGLAGLALLLYLFYIQWKYAAKLPSLFEQNAARGLVLTIAITALFNSPLLDHTEGLFFSFVSALLFANLNADKRDN